ncbi:hypothetical protein SUDANB1_00411 [Streptomyces sp. enrichment culture]|uniref:hypothetical protein n=1 Tax=Streptomyces sp. enrichment culture TaxID=1795815 RepID=UPI003F55D069
MQRRVSRAKYNEAIGSALRERRWRLDAEEKLAIQTSADTATADTITRLHSEASALRGIVAAQVVALEAAGRGDEALALRQQLGSAGIDLTVEIGQRQPTPGALPATRTYTPAESRLVAELFRRNKAAGALEDQLFGVQRVNEAQALLLRTAEESAA